MLTSRAMEAMKELENFEVPKDVLEWVQGIKPIPEPIKALGDDVATKINWFMMFLMIGDFGRIPTLFNYMKNAEKKLFDLKDFNADPPLSNDEIQKKYNRALESFNGLIEYSRKFLTQNSSLLKGGGLSEEDALLLEVLKKMDKGTLEKVKALVKEAKTKQLEDNTAKTNA